ncbi:MAG: SDR family oxidoreductase [Bacteroidota bacterium]
MDLDLTGKRAYVCGSSQGIGKACALELAALGANITLVARSEELLLQVLNELPNNGQDHNLICADFDKPKELKEQMDQYLKSNPKAHILVNNTGGPPGGRAIDADLEEFRIAFNRHLICNQIMAQSLVPFMKEVNFGRIINIISTSVKSPLNGLGVSNTIRGGVANWSKTLANELGGFGITVNNVLPGATATARLESIIANKSRKLQRSMDDVSAEMINEIPAGRFAEASEIASAVSFLASPSAAYINGVNLPVDGGRLGCL